MRKYWNPFSEAIDNLKSKDFLINKLFIIANVYDPRRKMNFAYLCFEKHYGKESALSMHYCVNLYCISYSVCMMNTVVMRKNNTQELREW